MARSRVAAGAPGRPWPPPPGAATAGHGSGGRAGTPRRTNPARTRASPWPGDTEGLRESAQPRQGVRGPRLLQSVAQLGQPVLSRRQLPYGGVLFTPCRAHQRLGPVEDGEHALAAESQRLLPGDVDDVLGLGQLAHPHQGFGEIAVPPAACGVVDTESFLQLPYPAQRLDRPRASPATS